MVCVYDGGAGDRRANGDGRDDDIDIGDVGGGVKGVCVKVSLRFTFCEVRGSVVATVAITSCFCAVGVRRCPDTYGSLAIWSGLHFFRGEGFVGS